MECVIFLLINCPIIAVGSIRVKCVHTNDCLLRLKCNWLMLPYIFGFSTDKPKIIIKSKVSGSMFWQIHKNAIRICNFESFERCSSVKRFFFFVMHSRHYSHPHMSWLLLLPQTHATRCNWHWNLISSKFKITTISSLSVMRHRISSIDYSGNKKKSFLLPP